MPIILRDVCMTSIVLRYVPVRACRHRGRRDQTQVRGKSWPLVALQHVVGECVLRRKLGILRDIRWVDIRKCDVAGRVLPAIDLVEPFRHFADERRVRMIAIPRRSQSDLRELHALMLRIDPEVLRVDAWLRLKEVVDRPVLLHHDDDVCWQRERSAARLQARPARGRADRVPRSASGSDRGDRAQCKCGSYNS